MAQFDANLNGWLGRNILPTLITIGVGYLSTQMSGIHKSLEEMGQSIEAIKRDQAVDNADKRRIQADVEDIYKILEAHEVRLRQLEIGK